MTTSLETQKFRIPKSVLKAGAVALAVMVPTSAGLAQSDGTMALGQVSFDTMCSTQATADFERGLILLHHMMYNQAEQVYSQAGLAEPDCAILHWGSAMTYFHPMWPGVPSKEAMEMGRDAVARMNEADGSNARIAGYLDTVSAFYNPDLKGYGDRLAAWADAQDTLFKAQPDDIDAGAFYALSQLSTAPRGDKTVAVQRNVGALLEGLHDKAPLHPGVYHYAIHAYDNPPLAHLGARFAQGYGQIAPDVPHALHMPSHIFVRLGKWEDTVAWNIRSGDAALAQPLGDTTTSHYAHAQDYRIYAHLQLGDFSAAQEQLDTFLGQSKLQVNFGSAYALAASPVRLALEQENWREAANLSVQPHAAFPSEKFLQGQSIIWFGKGLGAARSGNNEGANTALTALADIQQGLVTAKLGYWAQLAKAQSLVIRGWVALNEGHGDQAISLLGEAADIEDGAGKSPVTPGHVLPARELLGDALALLGRTDAAISAYETVLKLSPNRRRSVTALHALATN